MNTIKDKINTIIYGNALEILKTFPDESINMCICSPPYWGLRNYNTEPQIWNDNWKGELGQEPTPDLFISHLCDIFDEVKRVLCSNGTVFCNISDTYISSGGPSRHFGYDDPKNKKGRKIDFIEPQVLKQEYLQPKSLALVPERFAIKMTKHGFILRNCIIWEKPNQMPSSAKDRFTNSHEYIYFFTKSPKYYFQQQLEPYEAPLNRWGGNKIKPNGESLWDEGTNQSTYRERNLRPNPEGRNMRTVWSINTKPSKEEHYSSYPEELINKMILAGCPENGIVLDPFCGSGTTLLVAKKLGRNFYGIELNPTYIKIAKKRLEEVSLLMSVD